MPDRPKPVPLWTRFAGFAMLAALVGCASVPPAYTTRVKDPWEKLNRITYAFNDKLDKAVARPVAKAYVRAMPAQARSGIHDVLSNLGEPLTIINDLLQGNLHYAAADSGRFLVNSTLGLVGWFDVAQHFGLPYHDADLGETLAHWRVPPGPYLVLPFLGPSTVRDSIGLFADYSIDPIGNHLAPRYRNDITLLTVIDTRASLLSLDSTIDNAYDPYIFVRDAWIQHRRYDIYNGNPPITYPSYLTPPSGAPAAVSGAPAAISPPPVATTHAPSTPN